MSRKLIFLASSVLLLGMTMSMVRADLTEGLVGYWPLDGNAEDASGNGNHGVIEGNVTPTIDRFGTIDSAMNFPGNTSDYIDLGQPPMLLIKGAMTVAAWVRADTLTQNGRILAKQGPSSGRSWSIQLESAGDFARFDVGINPTDRVRADSEPLSFGPDEWFHIAGVFRPGEAVELYINGELVKSEPTTVTTQWIENGLSVNIGRRPQPGTPWQGDIDEVQMYNVALSPDEVRDLMSGTLLSFPKARGPSPADGALHTDTWVTLSWRPGDFAVSRDVYLGDNPIDVNEATRGLDVFRGNQTTTFYVAGFPGFAYPDGLVPGTTYYWRIDEVNEADPNSPWKGDVWSFTIPPKTAYNPDPVDGAESIDLNVTLGWTEGFGSKLHTVYFGENFDDVNSAAGGFPQGATTYTPGPLKLAGTYYWRVDEFDAVETYQGTVWSFTTEGAVGNPDPANGAVDVEQTPIITWTPGVYAASHQLYFGADEDAVKNADTGSPEYKGTGDLGAESYDPGKLEWNTTYYWRIDETNNVNPDSPWTGNVWSFTTANFLILDDFEDYDAGDNQIWFAWHDGLGYGTPGTEPYSPGNGTGSAVGDETTGSYTEETIVHGGNQSMPVFYDNSVLRYSEVEKTLTYPRDWTENGIGTLTIWFRGISANAAEPMYVALNGSAVVSHDNPNAAQLTTWTEWTIDLQAFADQGVNLANVNTIAIGLGNKKNPVAGGSGTMYFDDIRLYRSAEPAP
ncbi:MAG: LamG domain-containing protein [Phycisphaerae bacterium]